ncbi:MAG TPA: SDR family NAD(P)-dependent oxidoreductase [Anaerolineae bacterium]|nr:SDR family NAD(P)-dependent oxidoreductase [Anaerolineae bacterium]
MTQELKDKVAIVTGAGRGIGTAVAHTLARAGARVAVNDLNPDRAERAAAAIRESGGQAIGVMADVSNKFQCVHLVETTREEWGQLDILVNCAAIHPQSTILKMDEWEWQRVQDVNLKGTFFMSQLCGRVMNDENGPRGGVIVNIASTAGWKTPLENQAAYCAAAAGIMGFTRECAREYAAYGIRVYALALPERAADGEKLAEDTAVTVLNLCIGDDLPGQIGSILEIEPI